MANYIMTLENATPECHPKMTQVRPNHISLARASHLARSNFTGTGKDSPIRGPGRDLKIFGS